LVNLIEVAQEIERLEGVQSTVMLVSGRAPTGCGRLPRGHSRGFSMSGSLFWQTSPYALPDEVVVVRVVSAAAQRQN
jgi:hypothetical protein